MAGCQAVSAADLPATSATHRECAIPLSTVGHFGEDDLEKSQFENG